MSAMRGTTPTSRARHKVRVIPYPTPQGMRRYKTMDLPNRANQFYNPPRDELYVERMCLIVSMFLRHFLICWSHFNIFILLLRSHGPARTIFRYGASLRHAILQKSRFAERFADSSILARGGQDRVETLSFSHPAAELSEKDSSNSITKVSRAESFQERSARAIDWSRCSWRSYKSDLFAFSSSPADDRAVSSCIPSLSRTEHSSL